jgi:hypothetical protein
MSGARVDLGARTVRRAGESHVLSPREASAILALWEAGERGLPLVQRVDGVDLGTLVARLVDVVERDPSAPQHLRVADGRAVLVGAREFGWTVFSRGAAAAPAQLVPSVVGDGAAAAEPTDEQPLPTDPDPGPVLAALRAAPHRVVLRGPPGGGVSHLLRLVAALHPGPALEVDLTGARGWADLALRVGLALGVAVPEHEGPAAAGRVLAAAGVRLLVLDHPEGVVDALPALVDAVQEAVPALQVLVAGSVPGAAAVDVPALSDLQSRALLLRVSAVHPGPAEEPPAELVSLLQGNPLAIRLVAARASYGATARPRLLAELQRLTGDDGVADTVVDWSFGLLSPWEAAALSMCTVFTGPFPAAMARQVVDLSAFPGAPAVGEVLTALVARGFLRGPDPADTDPHLSLPVPVRLRAAEALRDSRITRPAPWPGASELPLAIATALRHAVAHALEPVDRVPDPALPERLAGVDRALAVRDAPLAASLLRAVAPSLLFLGAAARLDARAGRALALSPPEADDAVALLLAQAEARAQRGALAEAQAAWDRAATHAGQGWREQLRRVGLLVGRELGPSV